MNNASLPAERVARGARRLLHDLGHEVLAEMPLADGRRADLVALDRKGGITLVEVKSGPADYRNDHKWPDYRAWCDRFHFAVPAGFPMPLLPEDVGILASDGFTAALLREAPLHTLAAARRKAVVLRFARCAAARLARQEGAAPVPVSRGATA